VSRQTPNDDQVTALARAAAAAPSMHNAQPWRFRYHRHSRTFEIHADFGRGLPHSDPDTRALHLGCGAALLNLRVAAAHEGWNPQTRLLPDPADGALLARTRLTDATEAADGPAESDDSGGLAALHPAIHRRHGSRFPFEERLVPEPVREALVAAARAEGALLMFPASWHLRQVLDLVQEAEARNRTDPGTRTELDQWTRLGTPAEGAAGDGVPEYAFGPRKRGGSAPVRDFESSRTVAGRDATDFERTPQLALLSTGRDRAEDWLRAGQAMERVLLLATLHGVASSFVTQPLEWQDLRWPLRDPLSGTGYTQMILRLGYGPEGPASPRRPVTDVLDIRP
jgi:nitroreductase